MIRTVVRIWQPGKEDAKVPFATIERWKRMSVATGVVTN